MRLSAEFTEENIFRVRELLLGDFKNFPAVVAGDFMLDRYVGGDVSRISPEAPVPVVRVRSERLCAPSEASETTARAKFCFPCRFSAAQT